MPVLRSSATLVMEKPMDRLLTHQKVVYLAVSALSLARHLGRKGIRAGELARLLGLVTKLFQVAQGLAPIQPLYVPPSFELKGPAPKEGGVPVCPCSDSS